MTTAGPLVTSPTGATIALGSYINSAECRQLLGISKNTLQRWRASGHGPTAYPIGRLYRYKTSEVIDFIEGKDA
ncbi:helix-turn-helix domain-containing protein [Rhodococcus daqingensis]|uniref:Helix-turn-helix domain-containing protein n=1 Tax=Rhodococcus daqingensis TaxID=2479363 RepID=A0ABW2S4A0_9NOCA